VNINEYTTELPYALGTETSRSTVQVQDLVQDLVLDAWIVFLSFSSSLYHTPNGLPDIVSHVNNFHLNHLRSCFWENQYERKTETRERGNEAWKE
jgi:hypothetical protein